MAGNELADKFAKQALKATNMSIQSKISKSEAKSMIKKHVKKLWQDKWDREDKGRDFYIVNPEVGLGRLVLRCRKEEGIYTRMRIGHTRLNKTLQLIGKHNTGNCKICNVPETVEHVFMMCRKFNRERVFMKRKIEDSG